MTKNSYSEEELQEFKIIILQKARKAEGLISSLKSYGNDSGTDGTYCPFKCLEEGKSCLSKEEISFLIERQESFVNELDEALVRIENKTYGICRITNTLIPKERLRCVPHATTTIMGKNIEAERKKIKINGNGITR